MSWTSRSWCILHIRTEKCTGSPWERIYSSRKLYIYSVNTSQVLKEFIYTSCRLQKEFVRSFLEVHGNNTSSLLDLLEQYVKSTPCEVPSKSTSWLRSIYHDWEENSKNFVLPVVLAQFRVTRGSQSFKYFLYMQMIHYIILY